MTEEIKSSGAVPKLALTRAEAAESLGLTPVTVDRLTKRGLLRPCRATRRPLYPVWELERFLRDTSTVIDLPREPLQGKRGVA